MSVVNTNKENGFTLVEVLAALTILGIVFISYMTIFPQMVNMNERTEMKLESMNIAKKELTKVKSDNFVLDQVEKNKESSGDEGFESYLLSNEGDDYYITLDCYNLGNETCSNKNRTARTTELYKIHIKVLKETKLISESFGYLKLK